MCSKILAFSHESLDLDVSYNWECVDTNSETDLVKLITRGHDRECKMWFLIFEDRWSLSAGNMQQEMHCFMKCTVLALPNPFSLEINYV